jgi:hypothetical protein
MYLRMVDSVAFVQRRMGGTRPDIPQMSEICCYQALRILFLISFSFQMSHSPTADLTIRPIELMEGILRQNLTLLSSLPQKCLQISNV